MRCPNCGRDNPDIRLFCAYCGEILPEKDTSEDNAGEITENRRREEDFSEIPPDRSEDTAFYRRREHARRIFDDEWDEPIGSALKQRKNNNAPDESAESRIISEPHSRYSAEADRLEPNRREYTGNERPKRAPNLNSRGDTRIPPRESPTNPDNFFAVSGQDDYDSDEDIRYTKTRYEDSDKGQSFALRHLRGIVSLLLLGVTVIVVIVWAITPSAQLTLAKLDMAWSAKAYERLGLDAYNSGDFTHAAHYFSQALNREEGNESYAVYAANSFIEIDNRTKAAECLRRCIGIDPKNADYYVALMGLYSGFDNMPKGDRDLIDQGYRFTGDSRLEHND